MLTCAVQAAPAQEPARSLTQYYHTAWTARDGAPSDVAALAQTKDGYLWLGSSTGLFRFDGVRFESYEPPGGGPPLVNATRLLAARDGALWIGFLVGGVAMIDGDTIRRYGTADGLPTGGTFALAQDSSGAIWAGSIGGLGKFDNGRWRTVGENEGFVGAEVSSLVVSGRGDLWVSAGAGVFRLPRGQARFELVERTARGPTGGWEAYIAEAPDGRIWASDRRGLRLLFPAAARESVRLPPVPEPMVLAIDRTGVMWAALREGLQRVEPGTLPARPDQERMTIDQGLSGRNVSAILEDREGNIWVATVGGLDQFRPNKFVRVMFPQGTVGGFALAAADSGRVWVGSTTRHPMRVGDVIAEHPVAQRQTDFAWRDTDGSIWLGGDRGLWHSRGRSFARVALPDFPFITVWAMTRDAAGHPWVSLGRRYPGVFRQVDGEWLANAGHPDMPRSMATVMTAADNGRLWLGYARDGAAWWRGDSVRVFSPQEMNLGAVFALAARGRHVWAGGEQGLARLAGNRFHHVKSRDGPGFRLVTGIVERPDGELWVHGATGVARIPAAEVARLAGDTTYHVSAEWLDFNDGLDGAPSMGPLPSMIAGTDGRLWVATNVEVVWLDPDRIARNPRPPPVVIQRITAGERTFPIVPGLELPVHTRSLKIEFTALSLTIPERVRFRYQLSGSDDGWQHSDRRDASYTNLSPGSYRFRVIAANEDGLWNEEGATLDFIIPPSVFESRWFLAVWVAALSLLAWLAYRLRLRRMAVGLRVRYQAVLSERSRIAQELHDTLLQGFTGITIQLRAIQRVIGKQPEEGAAALERALGAADTALRDARHMIWDMHAVELESHDLPEALEGAARSVIAGGPVALEFTMQGAPRRLTPTVETSVLRIGREAVLNALKHASATRVLVRLEYEADSIRLEVRDDGSGILPSAAEGAVARGHLGIAGIRDRVRRGGGTVDITGQPGKGTSVLVRLPIDENT